MPFDPAAAKREVKRLEAEKARISRRIRVLSRRIYDHAYRRLFREVTSKPIDWDRMSFPVGCRPVPGRPDNMPITCIVCRTTTTDESYESGGPVPRGLDAPSVNVHTACLPKFILDRWSCD